MSVIPIPMNDIRELKELSDRVAAAWDQFTNTDTLDLDPLSVIVDLNSKIDDMASRFIEPEQPEHENVIVKIDGEDFRCPGFADKSCGCNVFHKHYIYNGTRWILAYVCNACGEAFESEE